jgi:protoporphyrinogen oxidase
MGYYYRGGVQAWGDPLALLSFPGLGFLDKFRYGVHAFLSTKRRGWQSLDEVEATAWIQRWVGPRAFDVLWKQLFELKFYDYAYDLSAAWIWSRIRRIGRSRYSMFREKLGYLDGGSELVLHGMRDEIERRGGIIRLKTPVSRVVIEQGTVSGIEAAETFHPFETVVSTVPMPYVPRIMPGLPRDVLEQYRALKNIAVVCVIAKLRKAVTGNFWLNVNDPDMDIPGLVEYTNLRPLDDHVVYVPFYMPGEHPKYGDTDAVFIDKVKRYIRNINPALTDDDFIEVRASRYRHAQPVCPPGFASRLPPIRLPVEGLFVADTSFYYPEDRGISESVGLGRRMARMALS